MNLVIISASACPSSWLKHSTSKLILVFYSQPRLLQETPICFCSDPFTPSLVFFISPIPPSFILYPFQTLPLPPFPFHSPPLHYSFPHLFLIQPLPPSALPLSTFPFLIQLPLPPPPPPSPPAPFSPLSLFHSFTSPSPSPSSFHLPYPQSASCS